MGVSLGPDRHAAASVCVLSPLVPLVGPGDFPDSALALAKYRAKGAYRSLP